MSESEIDHEQSCKPGTFYVAAHSYAAIMFQQSISAVNTQLQQFRTLLYGCPEKARAVMQEHQSANPSEHTGPHGIGDRS
ncbi:hypothetical protein [Spirochaeta dissipatitropha]